MAAYNRPIHIALDFDKTLAYHESAWGISRTGDPIWPMVDKVKAWLELGYGVTIFSVRFSHVASLDAQERMIDDWLQKAGLPILPKTAVKSRIFTHFIDDRAYHVKPNAGEIQGEIDI